VPPAVRIPPKSPADCTPLGVMGTEAEMARRERHYRVWPRAYREWEALVQVPHLLTDVVDAIESLPESELVVTRYFRSPAVVHSVEGPAFGLRFEIRGIRSMDGKWVEVMKVRLA
jgi:hypothetical protein